MELAWPRDPSARQYRVLVRDVDDERYVVKQPVDAPPYRLDVEALDPSHLHRWRVQARGRHGIRWKDRFPDVLLPAAHAGLRTAVSAPASPDLGPHALLTWPGTGASAYRVAIRDEDTQEIVTVDTVQGTAYAVDWSQVDYRRRLRYRVQGRKGRSWVDLAPFRILHPPLELLPGTGASSASSVSLQHLILTRFSLRSASVGFRSEWEDGWLEQRLELFERYCLPSMLAQTSQAFTWLVFCDPSTPADVVERLSGYSERITVAECRRVSSIRGKHPDDLRNLSRFIDPERKVIISTRLDSDDALHRGAVEQIQRHASTFWASPDELRLHTFPFGCKLDAVNGLVYRSRYQQNAFLSLFERCGDDVQGIMQESHIALEKRVPFERDFSLPGWLQVLHGGNVSNRVTRDDAQVDGLDLQALFGLEG